MAEATHGVKRADNAPRSSMAMAPQGFSGERRVRRRREFQQVFEHGQRIQGRYVTLLVLANARPTPRLGIVASRKLGGAVTRNRAKRLIREIFRRNLEHHRGPAVDAVVIPRRELLEAPFESLVQDFQSVWRRAAGRVAAHARG